VTDEERRVTKWTTSDGTNYSQTGVWGYPLYGDNYGMVGARGIAVDSSGDVYVAVHGDHAIKKYNSNGVYITQWGSEGTGDLQFDEPRGIGIDSSGYIYVVDYGNHRIQKFTSTGAFVTKWGTQGTGDGQFNKPMFIAINIYGRVYVTDVWNHRVQRFH